MSTINKTIKLSEIIDFKNGKKAPEFIGNIPIYGGNGILGYTNKSNYKNVLIIGRVGAFCGSVHIEKENCWVSDNAIAGIHKFQESYEYNYYLLKSLSLNKKQVGSSQPLLTQGILNDIDVNIFSNIETQKNIGRILSALDEKIELNNKINAELEAMAKTLYDYWFVQFDFPNEEGKPYKSSGGKMVWNEELKRDIPEDWEVKNLDKFVNITTGKLDSNAFEENGVYSFFTCAPEPLKINSYAFEGDVILIAGNNASGNFHINRFNGKFNAYQRTYILTSKSSYYLDYLFYLLKSELKKLKNKGQGSQTKFLTMPILSGIKILDFKNNEKLIKKFYNLLNPIYRKQNNLKIENQELATLRDWLLPMLMNGQVKVK